MDESPSADWTSTDAWVLAATSDRAAGRSLSALIGEADAINHATPTRDELASSLGALIAVGLIQVDDGLFRTTEAGRAIKKHWTGGLFNWSDTLLPHLAELPRPAAEYPLTEDTVTAAHTEYMDRHRAWSWRSLFRRSGREAQA